MTQEEKQLLLTDLCARLPYGVIIQEYNEEYGYSNNALNTISIGYFSINESSIEGAWINRIENIKPYLRSLSSMTEEEKEELKQISNDYLDEWENTKTSLERWKLDAKVSYKRAVFYNSHHIDWNDLISKDLAIEINKKNNPYEV